MTVLGELEEAGKDISNDPLGVVWTSVLIGLGLVIVGGIALGLWRLMGGTVSGSVGSIIRGLIRMGTETVQEGVQGPAMSGAA